MTWTATLKFAPLLTVERANDPDWERGDRTMVTESTFRFKPPQTSIPLIVDHDYGCELGTIHDWFRLRWVDGDWIAATATLHAPPPPFLHRGARVSYGCRPLFRRAVFFGRPEGQVLSHALLEEVSVLTRTHTPCEPLAEVLGVREAEPSCRQEAEPVGEVIYGGPVLRRTFRTPIIVR